MERAIRLVVVGGLLTALAACRSSVPGHAGIDPYAKDVIDAATKLLGVVGIALAVFGAWTAARTRRQDLRWRMMTAAEDAMRLLHKDALSAQAIAMLDCFLVDRAYSARVGETDHSIWFTQAVQAVANRGRGTNVDVWVYECFDWFLYYVDRLAYLDSERLIRAEDVGSSLRPYAPLIQRGAAAFAALCADHGYTRVLPFFQRLGVAPQFAAQVVNTADHFSFRATRVNGVTQTREYPWQNSGTFAKITQSSSVSTSRGSAMLAILGPDGSQVYSNWLTEVGTFNSPTSNPGAWTIRVILIEVRGTLNFLVQKGG